MTWNKQLTKLNSILAELYPIKDQSYRIVDMAGIPGGHVAFKDSAMDNWYYILKEANKRNKTEDLVQVVLNQYPDREDLKNIFVEATERKPLQPVENTYLYTLKAMLKKGDTVKAVDEFEKIAQEISDDLHNSAIMQSARLNRARNDRRDGLISAENYNLTVNQVNHALLQLIDSVPEEEQLNASRSIIHNTENNLATPPIEDLEKIIGRDELMDINWLQKAIQASRSVCKVMVSDGHVGTGFMLRGGYLLTNNHVIETADQAVNSKIVFNFQRGVDGQVQPVTEYCLDGSFFVTSSFREFDYALLKVDDHDGQLATWGHLDIEKFMDPQTDERVNIIQHPEGKSMKIALPDKIISKWKQYLFYLADTKGGSSGSPVFNQDWKVIALHHAGKNEKSSGGGMQINEAGDIRPTNRGILIKNILEDIKSKGDYATIVDGF